MSRVMDARMGRFARIRMNLDSVFDRVLNFVQTKPMDEIRSVIDTATLRSAVILRDEIRRIYKEGDSSHPRNHPWTILMKGSNQPLYESGELAESIDVKILHKSKGRVEIRVAPPPGENAMKANIAEQGMIIKVTPAMRRFFFTHGINIKRTTRFLVVPPRPVFPLAIANKQKEIEQEIRRQVEAAFGRIFSGRTSVRFT